MKNRNSKLKTQDLNPSITVKATTESGFMTNQPVNKKAHLIKELCRLYYWAKKERPQKLF
ncbi:MAG: hypothetical protein CM1200mP22_24980 [Dehalococcoidia bacterium]|nr:MAG: hypothetical protein CM1200mP22_24980 [Dehalococcoidia bacterium]